MWLTVGCYLFGLLSSRCPESLLISMVPDMANLCLRCHA